MERTQTNNIAVSFIDSIFKPTILIGFFFLGSLACIFAGLLIEYEVVYNLYAGIEDSSISTVTQYPLVKIFASLTVVILVVTKLFYPFYIDSSFVEYKSEMKVLRGLIVFISIVCVFIYTFAKLYNPNYLSEDEYSQQIATLKTQEEAELNAITNEEKDKIDENSSNFNNIDALLSRQLNSSYTRKRTDAREGMSKNQEEKVNAEKAIHKLYEERKESIENKYNSKRKQLEKQLKSDNTFVSHFLLTFRETLGFTRRYDRWMYNSIVVFIAIVISLLIEILPIYSLGILSKNGKLMFTDVDNQFTKSIISGSLMFLGVLVVFSFSNQTEVSSIAIAITFLLFGSLATFTTDYLTKETKNRSWRDIIKKCLISGVISFFIGIVSGIIFKGQIDLSNAYYIGAAIASGAIGKFFSDFEPPTT